MKKKKYGHITNEERSEISILLCKKYSYAEIAKVLGRDKGTISREIERNSTNGVYEPKKAQHKAYVKRLYSKYQGMKVVGNKELKNYIEEKMKKDWSPEEISGRIKNVDKNVKYVSFRGIYKYIYSIYGRRIEKFLRCNGKKRRGGNRSSVTKLKDRIFIDQRPKVVENRARFGDWEGDFIVSGKSGRGVLLVLHERKARFAMIKRIINLKIEKVHQFIFEMTGGIVMNTLTLDNDIVFRKHKELSLLLGKPVYFCHPYHSWEKGGVENTNKLIRQYIPKGSDISQYTDGYIQMIQEKLNTRPRKCLNYKTPLEVMKENKQFKTFENWILKYDIIGVNKKAQALHLRG